MAKKKKSLLVSLTPSILAIAIGGYTIYSFGGDMIKSAFQTEVVDSGYATVRDYVENEMPGKKAAVVDAADVVPDRRENTNEIEVEESSEEEIPEPVILPEEQDSYLLDNGYQFLDVDFDGLNEKNPDVVGYIQIPNTNIDYPVVQGEDNEYYLHHGLDKGELYAGSIFIDNEVDLSLGDTSETVQDRTISIFGHNMKNKTMFGDLVKFKKQAFLDENPYGVYYSEDGSVYAMEIVGTFITSGDTDEHLRIRNLDDINVLEEFKSFINENAVTRTDVDINLGDKVGILSTCTYEYNNARYAVVVVFKKQYLSLDEEKEASLTK